MHKLPFTMQTQQQESWCWAAVAASVAQFYDPGASWRQCDIASHCLRCDCCVRPETCNSQYKLDHPLLLTNNLHGTAQPGSIAFLDVLGQIDLGRPVCCHIRWPHGDGHFVAISGYEHATDRVYVDDPQRGSGFIGYENLLAAYAIDRGIWDYTYYTKPPSVTASRSP